jgi:hypothetical protein
MGDCTSSSRHAQLGNTGETLIKNNNYDISQMVHQQQIILGVHGWGQGLSEDQFEPTPHTFYSNWNKNQDLNFHPVGASLHECSEWSTPLLPIRVPVKRFDRPQKKPIQDVGATSDNE